MRNSDLQIFFHAGVVAVLTVIIIGGIVLSLILGYSC